MAQILENVSPGYRGSPVNKYSNLVRTDGVEQDRGRLEDKVVKQGIG